MPTVLLMLSGGVDSTFLLHHYLTRTDFKVHAHHISIRYPRYPRWEWEDPAVDRIVAHCREAFRDFAYSESSFGFEFTRNPGWDSDLQLLVASKVAPNIQAERLQVALGWSVEDLARPAVAARSRRQVTPNLWRALWASIDDNRNISPELAMPLVDMGVTRVDMFRGLPRAMLEMCWSCRCWGAAEGKSVPCGECESCKLNLQAMEVVGLNPSGFPNLVGTRQAV